MLIVGSRALALTAPNLLSRKPLDFDFVCTEAEFDAFDRKSVNAIEEYAISDTKRIIKGDAICEFEISRPGTSTELLLQLPIETTTSIGDVPPLDLLFTLKQSHRYKKNSPHIFKTLLDWHAMRNAGAKVRPEYAAMLALRERETYAYKHPSLNQTKKAFFADDAIQYVYDHDTIHKAVALLDRPAYTYYLEPGQEVRCSKDLFFSVPEEVRIAGCIEEAATLAIERSLVPHPGKMTPKQAWLFAFGKVITSITSGYFRQFAYEHAIDIIRRYPEDYYARFLAGIESGLVKRL